MSRQEDAIRLTMPWYMTVCYMLHFLNRFYILISTNVEVVGNSFERCPGEPDFDVTLMQNLG